MTTANQPSPAVVKKIQALAKLAADLRQGQNFNITKLTIIKSLCSDPDAAAKFALFIAKLAQRQFKARRPGLWRSDKLTHGCSDKLPDWLTARSATRRLPGVLVVPCQRGWGCY